MLAFLKLLKSVHVNVGIDGQLYVTLELDDKFETRYFRVVFFFWEKATYIKNKSYNNRKKCIIIVMATIVNRNYYYQWKCLKKKNYNRAKPDHKQCFKYDAIIIVYSFVRFYQTALVDLKPFWHLICRRVQ